jgi:hypothetical protein
MTNGTTIINPEQLPPSTISRVSLEDLKKRLPGAANQDPLQLLRLKKAPQQESLPPGFVSVSDALQNPNPNSENPFTYNPNQVLNDGFVPYGSEEFSELAGITGKGNLNPNVALLPEPIAPPVSAPVTQLQSPFQYIPGNTLENKQNILQNNQPTFPNLQSANNIVPTYGKLPRLVPVAPTVPEVKKALTVKTAIIESGNSPSKLQDRFEEMRRKNRR